ncbi:hypothetical protein BD410DRAFT_779116 [Rickenella mellea]|uniref:Uncharacterized protein n=1 Tax=Rickenella mellea TaxID=50990 RepID=A0A4Y7PFI1_9AGAM|nr:hypothetical protein BD410DRAFT_779116 [Rickenella mellea]
MMRRRLQTQPLTAASNYTSQHSHPRYARDTPNYARTSKHPKLTGYRTLVLALTCGFGIPKAVLMFLHRNNHADPKVVTSLDLALSVVCATALYWLGLYEESHPPWMRRWLFSENTRTRTPRRVGYEWHHPQLTIYRTIVLTLTTLFGTWKAVLSYMGQSTAPNMLEWQFGVVGIIWLFWLGWFEECHPEWMHSIFAEDNKAQVVSKRYPGFTAYRTLVITTIASFGISKAILTSKGKSVEANWIDLVLGVVCVSGLFWLGLYQRNCPESWRWFFIDEYLPEVSAMLAGICVPLMWISPHALLFFAIKHFVVGPVYGIAGDPLSFVVTFVYFSPIMMLLGVFVLAIAYACYYLVPFVSFVVRSIRSVAKMDRPPEIVDVDSSDSD